MTRVSQNNSFTCFRKIFSFLPVIVECSGGTWKEGGKNWICVSTERDRKMWPALKKKGATIVSTELILAGVLRQNLDIQGNKLC